MKIDSSMRGRMPKVDKPAPFRSSDGRIQGWRVTLPDKRPLATPAVVDGRVFIGGGFGGYEFYALWADSGELSWSYQTEDDGPTAAVVSEGHVAFNTECCELEVLTVEGTRVWKKWLGDPLMSMPAIDKGKVYMVYPNSHGDGRHHIARFDLRSGAQEWQTPLNGEIITAPVLAEGQVYLTTLDGTLWCLRQEDGGVVWQEPKNATSSPVVWNGQCYFSQRQESTGAPGNQDERVQHEQLAARGVLAGSSMRFYRETYLRADYLDHAKRQMGSPRYVASANADAGVGFGLHKGDAKMEQAMRNLGKAHVHAVWAYQGSKPFVSVGRLYSALGDTVCCADPKTENVYWKRQLSEGAPDKELLDETLTPPAIVNGKLFIGTIAGEVMCLAAPTGDIIWRVNIGEPISFQPAVARGRVYVATNAGSIFALETGDANDDGWLMWGADASHNGMPQPSAEAPASPPTPAPVITSPPPEVKTAAPRSSPAPVTASARSWWRRWKT